MAFGAPDPPAWCKLRRGYHDRRLGPGRSGCQGGQADEGIIAAGGDAFQGDVAGRWTVHPSFRSSRIAPKRRVIATSLGENAHHLGAPLGSGLPRMGGHRERALPSRQLRDHLQLFVEASNHARQFKMLRGLTPYERICQAWTKQPKRFRVDPFHHIPGPYTGSRPPISRTGAVPRRTGSSPPSDRHAFGHQSA